MQSIRNVHGSWLVKVIYILTNYVQIVWEKNVYEYKPICMRMGILIAKNYSFVPQKTFFMEDSSNVFGF